jgi:hypothetical protein
MKGIHVRYAAKCLILPALLALVACETTPPNRGSAGGRLDPTHDAPWEQFELGPRSADLIAATDKMARDIARRLDVNNLDSPPRVFVGPAENKTSIPNVSFEIFLKRLRSELQASGVRHGVRFIRERDFVEAQREREYGGKDPDSTADAYTSSADYVLTCEIFDLPTHGTNYFLMDYQLVQLREAATGPGIGPGAIVWENSYEVKFQ